MVITSVELLHFLTSCDDLDLLSQSRQCQKGQSESCIFSLSSDQRVHVVFSCYIHQDKMMTLVRETVGVSLELAKTLSDAV